MNVNRALASMGNASTRKEAIGAVARKDTKRWETFA